MAFAGLAILTAGCVRTVGGGKAAGVPFIKDKIESRYDRPSEEVFQAAKDVIARHGVLANEGINYGHTNAVNQIAKFVFGHVDECRVWVRVEQIQVVPPISAVAVQTRTKGGVSDLNLAAQLDKEIALKLVR